jgi:hypothetical protein
VTPQKKASAMAKVWIEKSRRLSDTKLNEFSSLILASAVASVSQPNNSASTLKQGGFASQNNPSAQSQSPSAYKINQEMLLKALSGRPQTDTPKREKKKRQNAACAVQQNGNDLKRENRDRVGSSSRPAKNPLPPVLDLLTLTQEEREDLEFNPGRDPISFHAYCEQLETDNYWH